MIGATSAPAKRVVKVIDLGRMEYGQALERQEKELEQVRAGAAEKLLIVEHPPVYTIGRGGDATFHGPGQIVAYPILSLDREGRDLHRYLRRLEEVVIRTLSAFAIDGRRIPGKTGVWVGGGTGEAFDLPSARKIASIGVGVRRWVTYHGLALNVSTDLDYFRAIVPCAIDGNSRDP